MTRDADVLVVGAGLAGAAAAQAVAAAGRRVVALDKGRGPGGRLSTRRAEGGSFDHGAAVLQAHGPAFSAWLDAETAVGRAARWGGGWVGVPGMNALVAGLLANIDVRWSTAVAALALRDTYWCALDAEGRLLARAPRAVLAVPAPQARALLAAGMTDATMTDASEDPALSALVAALAGVRYAPCWAGLAVVAPSVGEGAVVRETPEHDLDGVYREASKPGRGDAGHWVVHASAQWSTTHLELTAEDVALRLRAAFVAATGVEQSQIQSFIAHRWRYARPLDALDPVLALAVDGLAVAGDAVPAGEAAGASPAEQAWLSGLAAARHLLGVAPQPKS